MSDEGLVLKIGGDASGAKEAVTSTGQAVDNLGDKLKQGSDAADGLFKLESLKHVGEIAKEVFTVLTEQVKGSLEAYAEAEQASKNLTNALQNQGIYTTELVKTYGEYAESISHATGIEKDQITNAQAVAQSYLGQIPVTEKLTKAIADLSVWQGISLPAAAENLAKAIGNGTGMLLRQGIQFAATDTEADRYQKTLDFVARKADGLAESANTGLGSIKGLQTAFHEAKEELGERFAPAATAAIKLLTDFLVPAKNSSGAFTTFKAGIIAFGLVLSGILVIIPAAIAGFLALSAAITAVTTTLGIALLPLLGIAAAVSALIVGIIGLGTHWTQVSNIVSAAIKAMSGEFKGLGTVMDGVFHFDIGKIKAGLAEVKGAFDQSYKDVSNTWTMEKDSLERIEAQKLQIKKEAADKDAAIRKQNEAALVGIVRAENEAINMELRGASAASIALKKEEIAVLKQLSDQKYSGDKALLREHLKEIQMIESVQKKEDAARQSEWNKQHYDEEKSTNSKLSAEQAAYYKKEDAALKSSIMTEQQAQRKVDQDKKTKQIQANNTYLVEQKKYGTAYAAINKAIHSEEVQGINQATGELAQLTQSKNEQLKAIGKVAAVAQIIIQTAQAAMSIYTGFSTIPIIGPGLGIAGAAAAIAFGAEKISDVQGAARGGLMEGGIPGKDSIAAFLEPGELVAPRKNFEEVVNSVADSRSGTGSKMMDDSRIVSAIAELSERVSGLNKPNMTTINGDVIRDDIYIDSLVRRISEAVQYRNAKLVTSPGF